LRTANPKIVAFTKLFWANRGNHNEMTAQKVSADFRSRNEDGGDGAPPQWRVQGHVPGGTGSGIGALRPSLFDGRLRADHHRQKPQGSLDILQASANNFYNGVSLADVKSFHDRQSAEFAAGEERSGRLVERSIAPEPRTAKIPAGRYAQFLKKAMSIWEKAQAYAEPGRTRPSPR